MYSSKIVDLDLLEATPDFINHLVKRYSLVISTIPNKVLCKDSSHRFFSQRVWVTDTIKSLGEFEFDSEQELVDNLVVCSGDSQDWWYRQSRIHGWENTEYPHTYRPRETDNFKVFEVEKPLRHTCTCFPDVVRMGRYGQWQKGVLSHESFYDTQREILAIEQGWVTV